MLFQEIKMKLRTRLLMLACAMAAAACGQKEIPAPAQKPAQAPAAATTPAVADNAAGKSAFGKVCAMCHAAGVAGAPKPGDKADWGPRIAQGMDVLYKHSIDGFTGAKGMMPPRGGSLTLTDDELKSAVDYMVNQSR